jgi:hypothetical protein
VFLSLTPVGGARSVELQGRNEIGNSRLALVFFWVVFLAPVAEIRIFVRRAAWLCSEIEYSEGTAPRGSVSGWGGLCERGMGGQVV